MKTALLIVLAVVVLGAGSALSVMNNACKSSHHPWLRSDFRHAAPRKDWAQGTQAGNVDRNNDRHLVFS